MAAPTSSFIRVRLYFDYPPPAVVECRMCWLLVDLNTCRVVADLESIIRDKFELSRRNIVSLFIEECYLPHTESIYVVRDNDSIRVKVDSLAQVNGHSNHLDATSDNPRKRPRHTEEDKPAENGESMEWKKKKQKKKSERVSVEQDTKRALDDEQRKDSKKKSTGKKKLKGSEENGSHISPKSTTSTKKTSADVRGTKKPATAKAKTQNVSSSDSSDSSSEEDEAPKKASVPKPLPKKPCSTPAAPKAPPKTKLPNPGPSSSSSDTDSSSDEAPTKSSSKILPKNTPTACKAITSVAPKAGASESSLTLKSQRAPHVPQPTVSAQNQSAGQTSPPSDKAAQQPESSSSESEDEIKLVIRKPAQGLLSRGGMMSQSPWRGRGRGKARGGGGPGDRWRDGGRGSGRGQIGDFQGSYDGGQPAQQPCHNDLLTNKSVLLQNRVEDAPRRDYSSMPLLAAPPQVGQKIAFKLLELTENYTPEVSEYKEGKIVSFDPTTKQVELELLSVSQGPAEPGKFDLVYQNPDGSERVEYAVSRGSWVTERWDSLLEPRLVI